MWHSNPKLCLLLRRETGVLMVAFGVVLGAGRLEAATFYVSTSGNDGNSCATAQNITTPKRTINGARNCPSAGDTVYIRAGTYVEELRWHGGPRGMSWSNPITFAAHPGESVTVRPNSGAERALTLSNSGTGRDDGSQYLIFDGITFDGSNASSDVVKIQEWDGLPLSQGGFPPRHIRFTNFRFTGNNVGRKQGILSGGDDVQLIRGEIDHVGALGNYPSPQGVYGVGNAMVIDGVHFHHLPGWAISNVNSTPGIDVVNHIIRNNVFHNCGAGVNLGEGRGHIISNNLVYNNTDQGIYINAFGAGSSTDIKVLNNTVYNNGGVGISVGMASSNTNTVVRNNISFGNRTNYENDESTTVLSSNLFGANPLFVDAAGGNFGLQPGSPAIDAGATLAEVTTDRQGVRRPQGSAYDIGAHEHGAASTQTPAQPTGLRIVPN